MDPRALKCVFLGCKTGVKGYKVMNLVTKQIFLSRDVFYEDIFPLKDQITDTSDDVSLLFLFLQVIMMTFIQLLLLLVTLILLLLL